MIPIQLNIITMTRKQQECLTSEKIEYSHSYRYINVIILMLSAIANSFIVQVLSTINNQITIYIPSISSSQISLCALIFMIIHPFVILPSNYILDTYPIKLGISINCLIVIVGVCLRMMIGSSIVWVIIGNGVVALGNIFIINISAKFSAQWFPPSKRLLITSLIVFSNAISGQIGAILSPIIVEDGLNQDQGKEKIIDYMIYQGIAIVAIMIVNLLFFKGDLQKREKCIDNWLQKKRTDSYKQIIKKLFKSKQYLLLMVSMMLMINILNCFATFIEVYILPFGFTSRDAGISIAISVVSGLLASVLSGFFVKKYYKYFKLMIMVEYVVGIIASVMLLISLEFKIYILFWLSIALFGMFIYSVLPGLIQFTCEQMHPLGEATVSGTSFGFGELFSFLMGLLQIYILQDKTKSGTLYSWIINIILMLISLAIFWSIKRKENKEKQSLVEQSQTD